jgi:hypothetical protein
MAPPPTRNARAPGTVRASASRGDAEREVHEVVQNADLEDPEKLGVPVVPGDLEPVVEVCGDSRDEPGDAHHEEHEAHQRCRLL